MNTPRLDPISVLTYPNVFHLIKTVSQAHNHISLVSSKPFIAELTLSQPRRTLRSKRDDACVIVKNWDEFVESLNQKKLILAPWSDKEEVEKDVKARSKDEIGAAKTLCSTLISLKFHKGLCFAFGKPSKK